MNPSPRLLAPLLAALACAPGSPCRAADTDEWKLPPETVELRAGKGRESVAGQCVVCHSVDYVTTQPPLARAAWAATVEKMRAKYGAPLPTNAVPPLVDYLVTAYGKPHSKKAFGSNVRKWCDEAGCPDVSSHGLRKAIARRMAEARKSTHEIMAITGHRTLSEVERYTKDASQKNLAATGMEFSTASADEARTSTGKPK